MSLIFKPRKSQGLRGLRVIKHTYLDVPMLGPWGPLNQALDFSIGYSLGSWLHTSHIFISRVCHWPQYIVLFGAATEDFWLLISAYLDGWLAWAAVSSSSASMHLTIPSHLHSPYSYHGHHTSQMLVILHLSVTCTPSCTSQAQSGIIYPTSDFYRNNLI